MTADSLTYHFSRSLFHANEDGSTSHEPIDVYLDPKTLTFSVTVPEYIAKSPVDGATDKISGVAFGDLSGQYEQLSEAYSRWKLMANASPMLLLDLITVAPPADDQLQSMISFAVRECMATRDGRHVSIQGNPWIEVTVLTGTLIPNEPDIRDKLNKMIDSFNLAAGIMADVGKAEDPVAYLRALEVPWAQGPKTEKIDPALPASGGGDPINPQAAAEPVVDPDDEL